MSSSTWVITRAISRDEGHEPRRAECSHLCRSHRLRHPVHRLPEPRLRFLGQCPRKGLHDHEPRGARGFLCKDTDGVTEYNEKEPVSALFLNKGAGAGFHKISNIIVLAMCPVCFLGRKKLHQSNKLHFISDTIKMIDFLLLVQYN